MVIITSQVLTWQIHQRHGNGEIDQRACDADALRFGCGEDVQHHLFAPVGGEVQRHGIVHFRCSQASHDAPFLFTVGDNVHRSLFSVVLYGQQEILSDLCYPDQCVVGAEVLNGYTFPLLGVQHQCAKAEPCYRHSYFLYLLHIRCYFKSYCLSNLVSPFVVLTLQNYLNASKRAMKNCAKPIENVAWTDFYQQTPHYLHLYD